MTASWKSTAALALGLSAIAFAAQAKDIPYREKVTLEVGQSVVIYGHRGECGQLPTAAEIDLPALTTGTLSVGNAGQRKSKSCKGITPAVEIIFTATSPGREKFEIDGDDFSVRVK
jgi:hypothetical protein